MIKLYIVCEFENASVLRKAGFNPVEIHFKNYLNETEGKQVMEQFPGFVKAVDENEVQGVLCSCSHTNRFYFVGEKTEFTYCFNWTTLKKRLGWSYLKRAYRDVFGILNEEEVFGKVARSFNIAKDYYETPDVIIRADEKWRKDGYVSCDSEYDCYKKKEQTLDLYLKGRLKDIARELRHTLICERRFLERRKREAELYDFAEI